MTQMIQSYNNSIALFFTSDIDLHITIIIELNKIETIPIALEQQNEN